VLVVVDEDSATRTLAVRTEGDVIGEMAVITSRPRMAGLVARGPVRLLSIARRPFEAILRERPEISLAVMRVLCDRLADRDAGPSVGGGTDALPLLDALARPDAAD
jgi:CRP-like cAMP-binding protein